MMAESNKDAGEIERTESEYWVWENPNKLPSKERELIGLEMIALDWINFRYGGMWGRQ